MTRVITDEQRLEVGKLMMDIEEQFQREDGYLYEPEQLIAGLKYMLNGRFQKPAVDIRIGKKVRRVIIGGDWTFDELIKAGRYCDVSYSIDEDHFPISPEGESTTKIVMVNFPRNMYTEDIEEAFYDYGLLSPTYQEALFFGAQYPLAGGVFLHKSHRVRSFGGDYDFVIEIEPATGTHGYENRKIVMTLASRSKSQDRFKNFAAVIERN